MWINTWFTPRDSLWTYQYQLISTVFAYQYQLISKATKRIFLFAETQQQLIQLGGDHIVKKRLVVVNSEDDLRYYIRTGEVPWLSVWLLAIKKKTSKATISF